jgi:hypothetical protein
MWQKKEPKNPAPEELLMRIAKLEREVKKLQRNQLALIKILQLTQAKFLPHQIIKIHNN